MKPPGTKGYAERAGDLQSPCFAGDAFRRRLQVAGTGVSRRALLQRASTGFGWLAFAGLFGRAADPASSRTTHHAPRAKRVIFLFMDGGPSQVDTFDPKPRLQAEHGKPFPMRIDATQFDAIGKTLASPWEFARRGQSGLPVSELFPHLGGCMDDLCVIRSVTSASPEHAQACYFLHTGSTMQGRPSMGAWANYGLGTEAENLPGFVVLNGGMMPLGGVANWSSGFLPARYEATQFNLVGGSVMENLAASGPPTARANQLAFIAENDRAFAATLGAQAGAVETAIRNYELAAAMQTAVPEAADLKSESAATHQLYGTDSTDPLKARYARQCLQARRLVERGVRFVELSGVAFTGLPLGQVGTRGLMHRSEQLVNGTTLPPAFATISKAVGDPRLAASYAINTTRAQYDAFGNLTITRDPLYTAAGAGHEKEYTYDPVFHTNVEQETIRVGNGSADLVASASYDRGAGVMVGFTDFNGNSTSFQYDSFWRLVGIVKPGDSAQFPTAAFEYRPGDPFRGLYYNYAANGSLTLVNTADPNVVNAVTTHQREVAGQAGTFDTMSFTDGAGHKLGTLHEDSVPGQWVAKDFKRYSSQGEERKAFLPFTTGSTTYSVPTETQTHVASFYDAASRVTRTLNPPETTNANALVTQTKTIYLPLETQRFDEEDINPASAYYNTPHIQLKDGLDRLIGVIEVTKLNDDGTTAGGTNHWLTSYAYDLNDNLTHITDSQGNQKWFRYDGLKRKLFMNDPDRGVMTYTYDDASNLRSTLDAKAQAITYTYDGVNRLLTENYADGQPLPSFRSTLDPQRSTNSVAYFYDTPLANIPVGDGSTATARNTKGMLAYVQDLSGEEHTSYDARGRVEHVIKRLPDPVFLSTLNLQPSTSLVSYRTAFAYDSLDRVTTLTYPDSDVVGYLYSARNLLTRITGGPSGSIITNIAYRASDQLTQIDYGNNVRTTYDYDPRLRLNSLLTVSQPSTLNSQLLNFSYEFDGVSNIKAIRDQRPGAALPGGDKRRNTQLFQYDDLYRITRAQYSFALPGAADANNGSITYRYDRIGNMMNQSSDIVHNDRGVSVTAWAICHMAEPWVAWDVSVVSTRNPARTHSPPSAPATAPSPTTSTAT